MYVYVCVFVYVYVYVYLYIDIDSVSSLTWSSAYTSQISAWGLTGKECFDNLKLCENNERKT